MSSKCDLSLVSSRNILQEFNQAKEALNWLNSGFLDGFVNLLKSNSSKRSIYLGEGTQIKGQYYTFQMTGKFFFFNCGFQLLILCFYMCTIHVIING